MNGYLNQQIIPWVKAQNLIPEVGFVHVGVNFCGLNAFMTEHLLDDPQVGSTFQQMRGEGMTKSMRTDGLGDAGQPSQILDDSEHHGTAQTRPSPIEKDIIFLALLDVQRGTVGHP